MSTETFKKRQKEMARREKQQKKIARRLERRNEKAKFENRVDNETVAQPTLPLEPTNL
jgi:hypothetical protein